MAFSRQVSEQIERYSQMDGTNVQQLEGMASGVMLALKELDVMTGKASQLWTRGGVGKMMLYPDPLLPGSVFTKRWWMLLQASIEVFFVLMRTPLSVISTLAVTDVDGNVKRNEDGSVVTPFATISREMFSGVNVSVLDILWSEPEVVAKKEEVPWIT